jgi:hypothetical protein
MEQELNAQSRNNHSDGLLECAFRVDTSLTVSMWARQHDRTEVETSSHAVTSPCHGESARFSRSNRDTEWIADCDNGKTFEGLPERQSDGTVG